MDNDVPQLIENHSDSENENDDEWEEMGPDENQPVKCLFCSSNSKSLDQAIDHLKLEHKLDLAELKGKLAMDIYSYIKMINYIRHTSATVDEIKSANATIWADDKYMKPVNSEEQWLMYDFDELEESIIANNGDSNNINSEMAKQIEKLKCELNEKNALLQQAAADIENMKKSFKSFLETEEKSSEQKKKSIVCDIIDSDVQCVANLEPNDDHGYFSSYAHYGIHHDMLTDEVRTLTYRDAILSNGDVFKNKVVLDLGCGTSILSMFSSRAGANTVIGIDNSDIIFQAMDIVRRNNFENIKLIKGRLEETELPVDKVDVIVSEWMGYFLLFEGMLDSVIYARKRYLKEGGLLLPNRCNISICGYGDVERYHNFIDYWHNVYTFDMSCMRREVLREATIETCKPECIVTRPIVIADFDLMTVETNCPNFSYDFKLEVTKSGQLTAIVGYFDTFFELPNAKSFSTSPMCEPTHWKQVVFYMKDVINVKEGDCISGKFVCQRNVKDVRSLSITIEMLGNTLKYNLN